MRKGMLETKRAWELRAGGRGEGGGRGWRRRRIKEH